MISSQDARVFRRSLLRWYRLHGRDLPWRRTRDPYAIFVSEFMLQQTQVATVIPYYDEWLRRFPDFASLARASESEVLHAWQGLGYYRRAQNLHVAARTVQDRHRGIFPGDIAAIRDLPGVGRYTANAVATFAFDQSVPVVEANIARLLTRIFNYKRPIDSSDGREAIWQIASTLIPNSGARVYNSALMDLGALVCRPQPKCQICPVRKFCRATKPEMLPKKRPRPSLRRLTESHAWIRRERRIVLEQSSKRWRGMWILPRLHARSCPERQSNGSTSTRPIHLAIFPFTNHQITLKVFAKQPRRIDNQKQRWFSIRQLSTIPIPSPHRRAIVDLLRSKLSVGR